MNDLISRLSEIRSNYNCFDETEEPYYRALSEAIQLASAQPEQKGWVCPVCGRGLSPLTMVCPCNNGKGWEITCKI